MKVNGRNDKIGNKMKSKTITSNNDSNLSSDSKNTSK
jgi:hypothetical protein